MSNAAQSFIRSELIACPHGFSTRLGGVSEGLFESLNLGRLVNGDDPARVEENWRIFGRAVGIDTTRFVHGRQVHGNTVRIASRDDARRILDMSDESVPGTDGYVTNIPGLPLVVFTADCAPLLMHEPEAGVIAAVHCGWRPTAADIVGRAVEKMRSLGADTGKIRAAVGPCIRKCCFQTGPEVAEAMDALLDGDSDGLYAPDAGALGKYRVDLPGVICRRLMQLGVPADNIDDLGECTMCRPERYWSHRAMGMRRGSQANIIML